MAAEDVERFWDERARENALFFVDDRLDYRDPDEARFWASGAEAVDGLLGAVGAAVRPEDVVVDLGCGLGRLTRVLADRAAHVYALDVSTEMLRRAREHHPGREDITWVHGDGRSLAGIPDGVADALLSHVVFQHLPDPGLTYGYVRDMGRVLRPGAWAAFHVSNDPSIHRPRGATGERASRRLRAAVGRAPRGQEHPAWLGSAVDLGELQVAALEGGLELERIAGEGTQFCYVLARRSG